MTHLELAKKFGLTDFLICLFKELGMENQEITTKLNIAEQTIYNAQKRFEPVSEALKTISDNVKDNRNQDVQTVVDAFQRTYNPVSVSKYDRFAASRLVKKYKAQELATLIEILGKLRDDKYAPKINNIVQLEQKWISIEDYFKKLKGKELVKIDL
jgi:predicted transcriptional regulator